MTYFNIKAEFQFRDMELISDSRWKKFQNLNNLMELISGFLTSSISHAAISWSS